MAAILDRPIVGEDVSLTGAHVRELDEWPSDPDFHAQWLSLWSEQTVPLPFTHPDWVRTWWEYFGHGHRLVLLIVERDGKLAALAPLFQDRSPSALGRLRIVGYGTTNDYNDWLTRAEPSEQEHCLGLIFKHLAGRSDWTSLAINGIRPDSAIAQSLSAARRAGLLVSGRLGLACPHTTISGGWTSYLETRPRTLRYHLRSRSKRLAELGPVQYQRADSVSAPAQLEATIRLHRLRWADERNDAVFSDGFQGPAFYRAIIPKLVDAGVADITTLSVGDRNAASVVGFQLGGRYLYYVPAYDPELNPYVPGKLIVGHLMERAFNEGLETFDFMLGDESYKYEWSTQSPRVVNLTLVPDRWQSRALLNGERAARRVWSSAKRSPHVQVLSSRVSGLFR